MKDHGLGDFSSQPQLGASVFLSHSSEDNALTEWVREQIDGAPGIERAWMDVYDISSGDQWWPRISHGVISCDKLLFLASRAAWDSPYCRAELTEAWRIGKPIIVLQINHEPIPQAISVVWHCTKSFANDGRVELSALRAAISNIQRSNDAPSLDQVTIWCSRSAEARPGDGMRYTMRVPAEIEPSFEHASKCNTGILLRQGDRIVIKAEGKISLDGEATWVSSNGVHDYRSGRPPIDELKDAYPTYDFATLSREEIGRAGNLIGWIGDRVSTKCFSVGSELSESIDAMHEGFLHLAVNDSRNDYRDNVGSYFVTVDQFRPRSQV